MSKEEVQSLGRCFKFVFFRDPRTRLLSAYKDKVVRRGYLSKNGKITDSPFINLSDPPTFDQFLDYLEGGGLYANPHWAPQTSLLLLPVNNFDFYGRFENLNEDLSFVINKIFGVSFEGEFNVIGPPATKADTTASRYINEEQSKRILSLYKDDIRIFSDLNLYDF